MKPIGAAPVCGEWVLGAATRVQETGVGDATRAQEMGAGVAHAPPLAHAVSCDCTRIASDAPRNVAPREGEVPGTSRASFPRTMRATALHFASLLLLLTTACGGSTVTSDASTDHAPNPDDRTDLPDDGPRMATDASVDGGADASADATTCPLPASAADCVTDDECATIARGCYCGAQPVDGVKRRSVEAAAVCEARSGAACALGCAVFPGQRTQDGQTVTDGGVVAVRCARDGGVGRCATYARP